MEEEKLSIKITVADRPYPLKVAVTNEEKIRAAAKRINEKVALYRQHYPERDMHDALAVAGLQFVTKLIEFESKQELTMVWKEIADLDKQMEEYLQQIGA